jgi:hypothetical protein
MPEFNINLDIQGLVEALRKVIFTDPDDAIRELLTNAQDACILRTVEDAGFSNPHIDIEADDRRSTLTVSDNGIGMTEEDIRRFMATIGASSKRERLSGVQRDARLRQVGGHGLGIVAFLIVADRIEISSKSYKPNSQGFHWTYPGGEVYSLEPAPKPDTGTKVVLHIKSDYRFLASSHHVFEVVSCLATHLEIPVSVNGRDIQVSGPHGHLEVHQPPRISTVSSDFLNATAGPAEEQKAVIRFDLAGSWSVREFASWLSGLDSVYQKLAGFLLVSENDEVLRLATRSEISTVARPDRFETLMQVVQWHTGQLRLRSVHLASPGFLELVGSLNPIKTIAEFITAWRHENTLRDQAVIQANLEMNKLLAERAAELVKATPNSDFINRFLQFALHEPREQLGAVARDIRIEQVSWKLLNSEGSSDVGNTPGV